MGNCFSYGIILSSASFFPRTSIDDVPQEICRRVEKVFSLLLSTKVDTVLSDYVRKTILWKSKMLWKMEKEGFIIVRETIHLTRSSQQLNAVSHQTINQYE